MKKAYIILFLLVVIPTSVKGQEKLPKKMVSDFFEDFKKKNLKKLFLINLCNEETRIVCHKIQDAFEQTPYLLELMDKSNPFLGYEKMKEVILSEDFKSISYLVKHKTNPCIFTFMFYKVNNRWKVIDWNYDISLFLR